VGSALCPSFVSSECLSICLNVCAVFVFIPVNRCAKGYIVFDKKYARNRLFDQENNYFCLPTIYLQNENLIPIMFRQGFEINDSPWLAGKLLVKIVKGDSEGYLIVELLNYELFSSLFLSLSPLLFTFVYIYIFILK